MSQNKNNKSLAFFGKSNYIWMLIGAGLILIGMLLMSGGKSADPNVFNVNEVYGSYFTADFPARETVAVKTLPRNVNVEISVTAVTNL